MSLAGHQIQSHGDTELFQQALDWIDAGHEVSLATVVSTWGSSPCPIGSHLLIRDDNFFEGSVSGGCIEGEVVAEALAIIRNNTCKLLEFGVADQDAWEVGLACGGQIRVFVQKVSSGVKHVLMELQEARRLKQAVALLLDLENGALTIQKREEGISDRLNAHFTKDESGTLNTGKGDIFVRVFNPPLRLLIIGAVHIAQVLAKLANEAGYEIVVIDPRDTWGARDRFRGVTVDRRWPSTALQDLSPDSRTAVVTLCHDPKLDDPALTIALQSDAFYVGSLGSKKTHSKRLERLKTLGVYAENAERIKAPVGLDIGARTPAEIALSIMAEITQELRRIS